MKSLLIKPSNNYGFSFIEIILCLTLLGVLSWIAIPKDFWTNPMNLDAATRKVEADVRLAQSMATTTGQSHGFQVTGNSTYQIYNVSTGTVVTSPYTNQSLTIDLTTDFGGVTFQSTTYQVVFDSSGIPTTGGGTSIQLNSQGNSKQISISATSGYINLL